MARSLEVAVADLEKCWVSAVLDLRATLSTLELRASWFHPHWDRIQQARSLNKILPAVPAWIYANLERWHYLSFLRTNNVRREIMKSARVRALEPEKIAALIAIIEQDLGYQLHMAIQRVKFALSSHETAEFRFHDGGLDLRIP